MALGATAALRLAATCRRAQRDDSAAAAAAMPAAHRRRRPDWARQLPEPEAQGPSHPGLNAYAGLQQRYDREAERRAQALVERGYGALEPWLSAEPEPMTMQELLSAVARGSISGPDAAELWQRQQRQQRPPRAGRRRSVDRIDWGDAPEVEAA